MGKTSCEIEFSVIDTTAKADGTVVVNAKNQISDEQDLKKDKISAPQIATLENNYWVLDGTLQIHDPDANPEYGWWSSSMTGADGSFPAAPTLTVSFNENHTTTGITFGFEGDSLPSSIVIKWYGASNTLLDSKTFTPDGYIYYCENQVENFRKLVVTFPGMTKPDRYLKLSRIVYGQVMVFSGDDLLSASIQEEADPISAEVSINTAEFTVHSKDDSFNIVNPSGIYVSLQQRQPAIIREKVNGIWMEMGTYYLNEWENTSDNVITLKSVDAVGLLDSLTFPGGQWSGATVSAILEAIFSGSNVPYSLDASYSTATLSGRLEQCTKREAVQQVAFAIGAMVTTDRSDTVKIIPPDYTTKSTVPKTRKMTNQKLTLKPLVTGVEVTAHSFDSEGNDTQTVVGYYATDLPANVAPNVLQITDATLISTANASAVAQRVYEYYQRRYKNELSIITNAEQAGIGATIESYYDKTVSGMVESMEIDLVGGFISKIELVGEVDSE